jgi:hypothetical protein
MTSLRAAAPVLWRRGNPPYHVIASRRSCSLAARQSPHYMETLNIKEKNIKP